MLSFLNFTNVWDRVKAFFKRSEVIVWSRAQVLLGFVTGVLGAIDWSQISSWDFTTPKQTVWLGLGLIVNGVVTEGLRRRNMATGV